MYNELDHSSSYSKDCESLMETDPDQDSGSWDCQCDLSDEEEEITCQKLEELTKNFRPDFGLNLDKIEKNNNLEELSETDLVKDKTKSSDHDSTSSSSGFESMTNSDSD